MRLLLQKPLPGELLASALARTTRRFGLPIGQVTRSLTRGRKWTPGFFQAAQLVHFPWPGGASPFELLWKHSVLPYATAFAEQTAFDAVVRSALATGVAAKATGASTQSVSDLVRSRQFCPACAQEDLRRFGTSYWHRTHALPSVRICVDHACLLHRTAIPTVTREWIDLMPHEVTGTVEVPGRATEFDFALAQASTRILLADPKERPGNPGDEYRRMFLALGLLSPNRPINAAKLRAWFVAALGAGVERYGLNGSDANCNWLEFLVRPRSAVPVTTFKHLLLRIALSLATNPQAGQLDHVPSGPGRRSRDAEDRTLAKALSDLRQDYVRRGQRIRVSDALKELRCWGAYRHYRSRLPHLEREVQLLRRSTASARRRADRPIATSEAQNSNGPALATRLLVRESSSENDSGLPPIRRGARQGGVNQCYQCSSGKLAFNL